MTASPPPSAPNAPTRAFVAKGSEREFGLVFAALCLALAALGWWEDSPRAPWWLGASAVLAATALVLPRVLAPFNRVWLAFGDLLHKIVSPLVMGVLFFVVVTPVGLIMRAFGKDPLRLRLEPDAPSYWLPRHPPGPTPESIRRQF